MLRHPMPAYSETVAPPVARSRSSAPARPLAATHESWVDVARLLAAFLIVFGHVLNLDQRFQQLPLGSPAWIAIDAMTAGIRWSLPIFVMVSGYFLLDPRRELAWGSYFRRRMRRLAWPLLAWTALYLGIIACDKWLAGQPVEPKVMLGTVIKGAPYYHLWYLYMMPGLYLVAPFLKRATDHMRPGELVGAVALCFGVTAFSAAMDGLYAVANATYIDDFPRYLGYFLAGHLLGRVLPTPKFAPTAAVLMVSVVATAAMSWVAADALSPARALRTFGFGNPAIIAMSLAAFALMRRISVPEGSRAWLARAGDTTLGIYLVHPAILDALRHWNYPTALPAIAVQVLAVFLASLAVVLAMQRLPVLRRCV